MDSPRNLAHTSRLALRWADLDAFGHLNNVQYFRLMEECRVEWLLRLSVFPARAEPEAARTGVETGAALTGPVVAQLSCRFRLPVQYPAELQVLLFTGPAGRSSLETWHEIRSADGSILYAEGGATMVWVDARSGRPVPLPDVIRSAAARAG